MLRPRLNVSSHTRMIDENNDLQLLKSLLGNASTSSLYETTHERKSDNYTPHHFSTSLYSFPTSLYYFPNPLLLPKLPFLYPFLPPPLHPFLLISFNHSFPIYLSTSLPILFCPYTFLPSFLPSIHLSFSHSIIPSPTSFAPPFFLDHYFSYSIPYSFIHSLLYTLPS